MGCAKRIFCSAVFCALLYNLTLTKIYGIIIHSNFLYCNRKIAQKRGFIKMDKIFLELKLKI
jgi:hypothetical protein